ncbi:serine hydrolase domain-containing protein [Embleya hyalina]|uniref:serine hydrolase domain-containing protein n=1 Tax=Embleya hyalina TaxID=516124 RepID=UPI001FE95051|nr:serine hydrolase domain-containing protein [Embleya hyalina]
MTAIATVAVATGSSPHGGGSGAGGGVGSRSTLQRDVDRVRDAGAIGVLAEVRDVDGRRVSARSGVAELGTSRPIPTDAHVRIGSATKAFVAVVVLQLVGEGRLRLDDTVERWLPGVVAGNGNDGSRITVRQLLQHTSGLPQVFDLPGGESAADFRRYRLDSHSPEYIVRLAMAHPPVAEPGTTWVYSNTNYVLAGMLVRAVTGKTWDHETMRRITVPLGLDDTMVPRENPLLPHPHSHTYRQFAPGEPWTDTTIVNMEDSGAEGSIVSTTRDLGEFLRALVTGGLLAPAELAEMQRTVPVPEFAEFGMRYGLGLMWFDLGCGGGYWTHWGDTLGASTRGGITADGRRSVVVSVSGNGDHLGLPLERLALHPLVDNALCRGR